MALLQNDYYGNNSGYLPYQQPYAQPPMYGANDASGFSNFLNTVGDVGKSVLPFASPLITAMQGIFGQSAQSQFEQARQQNIQSQIGAINAESAVQTNAAKREADRQTSMASMSGARMGAAYGYTNPGAFTNPQVGRIRSSEDESLQQIAGRKMVGIQQAYASYPTQPGYNFPNAGNYLSAAFGGASQYMTQSDIAEMQRRALQLQSQAFRQ